MADGDGKEVLLGEVGEVDVGLRGWDLPRHG